MCWCRKTRTISLTFATIITVSVGVTRHVATLVHQFDFSRAQHSIDLEEVIEVIEVGERAIVLLVLSVAGVEAFRSLEVCLVSLWILKSTGTARGIHTHTHTHKHRH